MKDLYKVLSSLPKGTKTVNIDYVNNKFETKLVIYPSDDDIESLPEDDARGKAPNISIDEDLMNYL